MNNKYYVIQTSNGNVTIVSEWDDLSKAKIAFWGQCRALENEPEVIEAIVEIVYTADLATVGHYREVITHPQTEQAE